MMHRAKVLEDIVRILPPEVAARVNSVVDSKLDQHVGIEQVLASESAADRASSATSSGASGVAAASGEAAAAAPAAAAAELEKPPLPGFSRELESWVALAHMLASEVASVESQLQDTKLRPEKAVSLLRQVKEKLTSSAILPEIARSDSGSGSNSRARSTRSSPSLPPRPSEPCFTAESSREASLPASTASAASATLTLTLTLSLTLTLTLLTLTLTLTLALTLALALTLTRRRRPRPASFAPSHRSAPLPPPPPR